MKTFNLRIYCGIVIFFSGLLNSFGGPGALDPTYGQPIFNGPVDAMALQADGKLVVGGGFSTAQPNHYPPYNHLVRLFSDGSVDTSFFPNGGGPSGTVWCLAIQADGRIVIGGDFYQIQQSIRSRVARLNVNGTVDGSFLPTNTINSSVLALAVQTNGGVIIGGSFNGFNFPSWNARLNADGTTDNSFSSLPNGQVDAIAIQADGKIIIGGAFTMVNGVQRNRIARLNADGSLDNTFQNGMAGASSTVRCLQIQSDGKILLGGDFTSVNNSFFYRGGVARLNTDGSVDTGFNNDQSGFEGLVYCIGVQPNNDIVVGGHLVGFGSTSPNNVWRLYPDGSHDTTFTNYGINSTVQALALQSDGRVVIGGTFSSINNAKWTSLARLYGDLYPPEFVIQPASHNTNVGANVTFTAEVSNPTATSFQWSKDGIQIPDATENSYSLFNVQISDAGSYSVFVTDALGGTSSSNALLQVGIAPAITGQSGSLMVTQAQSASFNVSATGTPLNYFWQQNGQFLPGQTNASLAFAAVDFTNAGTYTCQVSNFLGSATSTGAVLTVVSPPIILAQPFSQTVGVGSNFTVSVTASGSPAPAYQWFTNGAPIIDATNSSYSVTGAQISDSDVYFVIISNSLGQVTSSNATISVVNYPPAITQPPVGGNVPVGSNFVLSAMVSGTGPFNWQWRTNGLPILGANASSYTINSAQLTDAGIYDVVVANAWGSITSSVAIVNVGYSPVVVQQPLSLTNSVGGSASFSCVVTGTVPISFQWTINGNPITDATNSTVTVTNLQFGNFGYYALTATNLFGGTVSSIAALNLTGNSSALWNGLLAYYPFSGNANDVVSTNNGTPVNAVLTTDRFGNANSAYAFDGYSSYIVTAQNELLNGASNLTISAWVVVNGVGQLLTTGDCRPGDDPISATFGVQSAVNVGFEDTVAGNGPPVQIGNSNAAATPLPNLTAGSWHHIVITLDAASNPLGLFVIYVDGQVEFQQIGANDGISAFHQVSYDIPMTFMIGALNNGPCNSTPIQFWSGNIDDLRIYNRTLSAGEVGYLYTQESQATLLPPQNLSASLSAGPAINLTLTGLPGHSYVLETATNLTPPIQWLSVLTNSTDSNGVWQFTDTNLDNTQLYYQIVAP